MTCIVIIIIRVHNYRLIHTSIWDTLIAGTKIIIVESAGNGMVKVTCEMVGEMFL